VDSPFNFTVTATNYVNTSSWRSPLLWAPRRSPQVAATSDSTTVDLSTAAYTKQLNVTGNNGAVNFTATGGSTTDRPSIRLQRHCKDQWVPRGRHVQLERVPTSTRTATRARGPLR